MAHIEQYRFGSVTVDGATYSLDILLLTGGVCVEWQREASHDVSPADLWELECHLPLPSTLVIGTGSAGCMHVSAATRAWLNEKGIALREATTGEAVALYNALAVQGKRVAAALHLTC